MFCLSSALWLNTWFWKTSKTPIASPDYNQSQNVAPKWKVYFLFRQIPIAQLIPLSFPAIGDSPNLRQTSTIVKIKGNRTFTVKRAFSFTMYRSKLSMRKEQKRVKEIFHLRDTGERWNTEILTEPTSGFPSEEHTNHIKYTKCLKMTIF